MTKQKRFTLPIGCLIVIGILIAICGVSVPIAALTGALVPAPVPTLDDNGMATAIFLTAQGLSLQTQDVSNSTPTPTQTFISVSTESQVLPPTSTGLVIPVTGAECIPNHSHQTGQVLDVVDGDTIKVLLDADGKVYSVRYIGMDTPEDTSQVEPFGPEATAKNSELVYGKRVTLVKDVSETDPYGRLLRYVIAEDVFVNYELVAQGYANTASYPPDVACISTFQIAEGQAFASKLGLWNISPTQVIIHSLPTVPSNGSSGESSNNSGGTATCDCNGPDLDCKDFNTHAAAQACYNYCNSQGFGDIFRLDGNDNDGLACESLP